MSEKSRAAEATPSSIGRYQITGTLGFGAMGAVYRAFDPIIKRPLAIKTIRLDDPRPTPQHKAFIERFYQEARISGTLSHPNIVTLFDIGEENGAPFLAMEYVEGETIATLLQKGTRFEPEKVISIVSQVAAGLDYAHSRGIVHRDIKPSNLIVQEGDRVKVTDFGIAKVIDSEITQAGMLLGTPSYMSPEQAMGEKLDGRSDIFSLGVCAFEMLSGQQPFPGSNVTSILYKLVHVDPIEPSGLEMQGLVPHKWREVFRKVLAKKPDARYQTAGEFVRDLEYCLGSWFTGLGAEADVEAADERTVTVQTPAPVGSGVAGPLAAVAPAARGDADTVALPVPSGVRAAGPDDSATVLLKATEATPVATETLSVPTPNGAEGAEPGPTTGMDVPTTAGPGGAETAAAPVRRPLPVAWILVGAAGLFVLAAAMVVWLLWPRESMPSLAPAPVPPLEAAVVDFPPPLPTTGTLWVTSKPEGAEVMVDGEPRGTAPVELDEIAFGTHDVRLELRGYEGQSHEVALSAEHTVAELQATLSRRPPSLGTARFGSRPEGGAVSVDGKAVGTTPLEGVRLRPGRHRVEIALDGHEVWTGIVEVEAGRRASLEADLVPVPVASPPTPEPVDTAKVYENKLGQVDRIARRRFGPAPSYPSDRPRLKSGERVSVTLSFLVSETGEVQDVQVTESGGEELDEVVTSAVSKWRYEPATIRDVPVRVRISFKQTFLGG